MAWQGQHGPPPLLHSHTQGIIEHRTVSKTAVGTSRQHSIYGNEPGDPVDEKSAGKGGEAAVEGAEESASNDCASEVAGEVGSSTAVSIGADMVCCVQGRSERRREEGGRSERDKLREMDFSKLRIMTIASFSPSIQVQIWFAMGLCR